MCLGKGLASRSASWRWSPPSSPRRSGESCAPGERWSGSAPASSSRRARGCWSKPSGAPPDKLAAHEGQGTAVRHRQRPPRPGRRGWSSLAEGSLWRTCGARARRGVSGPGPVVAAPRGGGRRQAGARRPGAGGRGRGGAPAAGLGRRAAASRSPAVRSTRPPSTARSKRPERGAVLLSSARCATTPAAR